mgnify:CR=1 FL=1
MKRDVTFGPMEVYDSTTGDAEAAVYLNRVSFGGIVKEVNDVGGTSFEYRTAGYTVTLDDSREDRFFSTEDHGSARGALAQAKAYARAALGGSLPGERYPT